MSALGLLLSWSIATALAADCAAPVTTVELQRSLEQAESAYIAMSGDALDGAVAQVYAQLGCLNEELPRTLAARTHRVLGLGQYGVDDNGAGNSFAAARSIEPGYVFPTAIAVEGNPLHEVYMQVDLASGTYTNLPAPAGRLLLDGRETLERSMSWPTIVQIFDTSGAVVVTAYLRPSDAMPAYPLAPEGPQDPESPKRLSPNRGMLIGAGSALLASGALYGAAALSQRAYYDPDADPAQLDPLRARTNGLVVATWVGGGAAVALGAGAFLVGEF